MVGKISLRRCGGIMSMGGSCVTPPQRAGRMTLVETAGGNLLDDVALRGQSLEVKSEILCCQFYQ